MPIYLNGWQGGGRDQKFQKMGDVNYWRSLSGLLFSDIGISVKTLSRKTQRRIFSKCFFLRHLHNDVTGICKQRSKWLGPWYDMNKKGLLKHEAIMTKNKQP